MLNLTSSRYQINPRILSVSHSEKAASIWPKMLSFMYLPAGWHYGEGVPASISAHSAASKVAKLLAKAGARGIDAFPNETGAITLNSYINGNYIEISCLSEDDVEVMSDPDCPMALEDEDEILNIHEIIAYLGNKTWNPADSFASYTQQNTTVLKKFSPSAHSVNREKIKASL